MDIWLSGGPCAGVMHAPVAPDAVELTTPVSLSRYIAHRYVRSRADELTYVGSAEHTLPELPAEQRRRRTGLSRSWRMAMYQAALQGSKAGYRDAGRMAREAMRSKAQ
jgi:hypothetical protein